MKCPHCGKYCPDQQPTKKQLEAYRLMYIENKSQKDAAAALGISQPAMSRRIVSLRERFPFVFPQKQANICFCDYCGKEFAGKRVDSRYCSQSCHMNDVKSRVCQRCGIMFMGKPMKWLCDRCSAEGKRAHSDRRQAAKRAARPITELIKRDDVFKRDNWECQVCGKVTNPDADVSHPLYPNVDHIIPLSRGGSHTMDNVQCACRLCNIKKSNHLDYKSCKEATV